MRTYFFRKTLLLSLSVILAIFLFWVFSNYRSLTKMPALFAAKYVKEYCSCYYILKKEENFCRDYPEIPLPIQGVFLDKDKKEISAKVLGTLAIARYIEGQAGCTISLQ